MGSHESLPTGTSTHCRALLHLFWTWFYWGVLACIRPHSICIYTGGLIPIYAYICITVCVLHVWVCSVWRSRARIFIRIYIYLSLPWRTILFPVHTTIFIIGLYLLVLPGADRILAQSINQIVCIAIGHSPILLMIHCVSYIVRFMFDQFCFGCVRRYQHCLLIGTVKPSSFNEFLFICCCCLFFFSSAMIAWALVIFLGAPDRITAFWLFIYERICSIKNVKPTKFWSSFSLYLIYNIQYPDVVLHKNWLCLYSLL